MRSSFLVSQGQVVIEKAEQEQLRETGVKSFLEQAGDGLSRIAEIYTRPEHERPNLVEAKRLAETIKVPVIDLGKLSQPRLDEGRRQALLEMDRACREWGFFQVINHGVPEQLITEFKALGAAIFSMPSERIRETLRADPALHPSVGRFETGFSARTVKVLEWRDVLWHYFPDNWESDPRPWPATAKPAGYKETLFSYKKQVGKLTETILDAMAENLGLEDGYLNDVFGWDYSPYVLNMNYYPACPEPELTLGISSHTDTTAVTLLLQDDVGGLQVKRNGSWITVEPIPNAFVVNIGDSMQAVTNGIYQSVEHRTFTNRTSDRMSFPAFHRPKADCLIRPAPALVTPERPALYRSYLFQEYLTAFLSQGLKGGKAILSNFLLNPPN